MVKWVDSQTISSFENHRDDSLCDKWLAPIDDGVKIEWNKSNYSSNAVGIVKAIDKDMNVDDDKTDSFDIHVWSDTDHDGIELTITETDNASGIFEARVFFTADDESGGTRLLVEDAVYAEHKSNVGSARIINESESEPHIDLDYLCPPGQVLDWDICADKCPIGQIESDAICMTTDSDPAKSILSYFVITAAVSIFAIISIVIIFTSRKKRKEKLDF